ncbi:MAG: UDP-galactopyranose mutase [Deferribacteraceae bacterium]|jgi:UDP-galactopyranose mutase|nr:UDP-galactopyranose mutase [Deferribacteraceae bacterium]
MAIRYDNLIVGCGLSGAVLAERLASLHGETSLVIDKKDHIAGNCYDYKDNGISVHRYGPHIFHTNNAVVWQYLSQFTDWHPYMHRVLVYIDGQTAPFPFNLNTIRQVFPQSLAEKLEGKLLHLFEYGKKIPIMELLNSSDDDLQFLANYIYEKVFKNYTIKQWGLRPEELDGSVTARVPISISSDNRYFGDTYQGIPANGYTDMIANILKNDKVTVKTGVAFSDIKDFVDYDRLIYTAPIDEYFDYKFGKLPYRSLKFDISVQDTEYYQSVATVNYPNDYDFTRITEFKHFLDERSDKSIIMKEFPKPHKEGENEPLYPIMQDENRQIYQRYLAEAQKIPNLIFAGRLGEYKYYDMDKVVERALEIVANF